MQPDWRARPRKFINQDDRVPKTAPELWLGSRSHEESLVDFFRRVWGPYLQYGLQSVQLRRLDARLWKALHQTIVRYEMPWPADLEIPNLKSRVQLVIEKLNQGRWLELSDREIFSALRKRRRDEIKSTRQKRRAKPKSA